MAETIKTTFSFSIGKESDLENASAEIDTRSTIDGGDNASRLGKTSDFEPGEKIAFLVYLPDHLEVSYVKTTLDEITGTTVTGGKTDTLIYIKNEQVEFESLVSTAQLSNKTSIEKVTGKWIGNDLIAKNRGHKNLTLGEDGKTLYLPELPSQYKITERDNASSIEKKMEVIRTPGIYIVDEYTIKKKLYWLTTPTKKKMTDFGKPAYPINIIIYLEERN